MSKRSTMIVLAPPRYIRPKDGREQARELFHDFGFQCSYCCGNGYFWAEDEHTGERLKAPCPACGGTGELDAWVTIDWKKTSLCHEKGGKNEQVV